MTAGPMRLGVPVRVLARPDLKSNNTRRRPQNPHPRVSLEHVSATLDDLAKRRIRMYRLLSDLAPYATHPDMPQFHAMVRETDAELQAFGAKVRALDIRLSSHPSQFVVLNTPDPELRAKGIADLVSEAEMLDWMGLEAVLVIPTGGRYADPAEARARWVDTWEKHLAESVRRRLALENDESASTRPTCRGSTNGRGEAKLRPPAFPVPEHRAAGAGSGLREVPGALARGGAAEDALLLAQEGAARGEAGRAGHAAQGDQADRARVDGRRGLPQPL